MDGSKAGENLQNVTPATVSWNSIRSLRAITQYAMDKGIGGGTAEGGGAPFDMKGGGGNSQAAALCSNRMFRRCRCSVCV